MKKKYFIPLVICVILIVPAAFYYLRDSDSPHLSEENPSIEEMGVAADDVTDSVADERLGLNLPPSSAPNAALSFIPTEIEDTKKFESLEKALKELGACLNVRTTSLDKNDQISFDSFNNAMSEDMGEVVNSIELWATTDLQTSGGEVRRILIENNIGMDADSANTLSYWSFANGAKTEIPLSNEQRANPSEALVASLEADGKVIGGAMSRRIFYQNGSEVVLMEKNGQMAGVNVTHEDRHFQCTDMDSSETINCRCQ